MQQKWAASKIFTGTAFVENQVLVLDKDSRVEAIVPREEAGDDVLWLEGIICPGFINSHCHLELSHLYKKVDRNTGLPIFLKTVGAYPSTPKEEQLAAIEKADKGMYERGVQAVGDICNTAITLSTKVQSKINYVNFIEIFGSSEANALAAFAAGKKVFDQFFRHFPNHSFLVPHAPYSISPSLWQQLILHHSTITSIHSQEDPAEDEWFRTKTGAFATFFSDLGLDKSYDQPNGNSSLQNTLPKFSAKQHLLLVHNVTTSQADIDFSKNAGYEHLHWCICANANKYITGALPPLSLFEKNGLSICIGTDSLASNDTLDIAEELRTIQTHFPNIALSTMLHWATLQGANALGLQHELGSFEKGKKPGVILVSADLREVRRMV